MPMSVFYASPNSTIALASQLSDGAVSLPKSVKATVRSNTGVVLVNSQPLVHVGNGLFTYASYVMPDEPAITVQYVVYDALGVQVDESYAVGVDHFLRSTDISFGSNAVVTHVIYDEYVVEVADD